MSHILLTSIAAILAATSLGAANMNAQAKNKDAEEQYEVIDLKQKVMQNYYDRLDENRKAEMSLEQFSEGYYQNNLTIYDYTQKVNQQEGLSPKRSGGSPASSSSPYQDYYDGDYMISNNHEDRRHLGNYSAPCAVANPTVYRYGDLPYVPNYNNELANCSFLYVQPGDIVIDPVFRGGTIADELITHAGIVEDIAKPYYTQDGGVDTFIRTIEAEPSGVRYGILDDERVLKYGTMVYRVMWAGPSEIAGALAFARGQLGKVYALTAGGVPTYNQSHWYCNELVWAAYYHQGINICETNAYSNYPGTNPNYIGFIAGTMILNSNNVEERAIGAPYYSPSVSYNGRTSSAYKFTIYNFKNESMTISYPKSAASFAQAITNASDPSKNNTATIAAGGSKTVAISKGGLLEGAVVFSTVAEGRRFMTLCTQLNNDVCSNFQYRFSDKIGSDPVEPEQPLTTRVVSVSKFVFYTPDNFEFHCHGGSEWYELSFDFSISDIVPEYAFESVEFVSWNDFSWGNLYNENFSYDGSVGKFYMHSYMNNYAPYGGFFQINLKYTADDGLDHLEISGGQRSFVVGEFPNTDTLVVTAFYRNGTSKVVERPNKNLTIYSANYDIDHAGTYTYTVEYKDKGTTATTEYSVEVTSRPILDYLSLEGNYQTEFVVNDSFNCDGLRIIGHFSNNSTRDLTNYADIKTLNVDMNHAGTYGVNIFVTYEGALRSQYYQITVLAQPKLHYIELFGDYQKSFGYGENFNSNGLAIMGHYTGERTNIISGTNSNLVIDSSDYNMFVPGQHIINVTYTEGVVTASASYAVTVAHPAIEYVYVSGDFQTEFVVGDEFNTDGLEVYVVLESGQTYEADDIEIDDSDVNMDVPGTYMVIVYGSFGGMTDMDFYEIEVVAPAAVLTSIVLAGNQPVEFEQGDDFSSEGLIVVAQYSDGSSAVVSGATIDSSLVNMNVPGTYPVLVSYTEDDVTKTSAYIVTVHEKEIVEEPVLESITLSGNYTKIFGFGETFNYRGLIVTAHYSDGSSREVTDFEVDSSDFNSLAKGTYWISVTYTENGVTVGATYKVAVRIQVVNHDPIGEIIVKPWDPDPISPIPGIGKF